MDSTQWANRVICFFMIHYTISFPFPLHQLHLSFINFSLISYHHFTYHLSSYHLSLINILSTIHSLITTYVTHFINLIHSLITTMARQQDNSGQTLINIPVIIIDRSTLTSKFTALADRSLFPMQSESVQLFLALSLPA